MTATYASLIDEYVADVTSRLPGRLRRDVGAELHLLLMEELRGRAADCGRLPDDQMVLDLVRAFGHPDEVATRYQSSHIPIIPPAETRGFVWASVIGVGLQWAGSLPLALSGQLSLSGPESARITAWWISYGLGALWWPGFLVTVMMIAAWFRRTWPAPEKVWKPAQTNVPDSAFRRRYALALAGALGGVATWILVVWAGFAMSSPFARALALDPAFLTTRAPAVMVYWSAGIALLVVLVIEGRWRPVTRRIDLGLRIVCCALLTWLVAGGRVLVTDNADRSVKVLLSLLIAAILAQLVFQIWRNRRRASVRAVANHS